MDEALEWFARRRNATLDADSQAAFQRWLASSPRHAEEYHALEAIWGEPAFRKAVGALPAAKAAGTSETRRHPAGRRWALPMVAAAIIVLAAAGAWHYPALKLRWQADYVTATGDRRTIALPDGSTVTLNTASAIALDFGHGRRGVRMLAGEAFFDVRPDPGRPFRVAGHFGEVEVKGTAFSVRMEEHHDLVILERGLVDVSRLPDRLDRVALKPGQMVQATAGALSSVTAADPDSTLAWREGRIIFVDQPMWRVLSELRRYYAGSVIVADSRIGRLAVTGNYRLDDIEGAIRTLADAAGVTMNRLPGGILILR